MRMRRSLYGRAEPALKYGLGPALGAGAGAQAAVDAKGVGAGDRIAFDLVRRGPDHQHGLHAGFQLAIDLFLEHDEAARR